MNKSINHKSKTILSLSQIDDLSREVGKLKDALNSLSQLSYSSSSSPKRQQNQQLETVQQQVKQLQYQLAVSAVIIIINMLTASLDSYCYPHEHANS